MRFASLHRAIAMSSSYQRRGSWCSGGGYSSRPSPPPPPPSDAGGELVTGDSHYSAVQAANDSRGAAPWHAPPPYMQRRGSRRPQHGYSARPSPPQPPPPDAGGELFTGDSHFNAVRAANDTLLGGGGHAPWHAPPPYRHGSKPQPHGYGQPQQSGSAYAHGSYGYGHPQQPSSPYGYSQPPPSPQYVNGASLPYGYRHPQPYGVLPPNAGFRPSMPHVPRLADYRRRWRYVQQRLPHPADRFKVLSYNILADYLAQEHSMLYEPIPPFILDWNWRKDRLLFEFGLWSPDIICLQEVDKFTELEQELASQGYSGIWKMRTGKAADGCAIFWRTARFQLCYEEHIEFNKLGLRDNVAQLCVLESTVTRNVQMVSAPLHTSSYHPLQPKQVLVCNIHVLYNPKRGDIKLGQVRTLLDRAYAVSKMWNDAPVILCGDFNSTPKSSLYNFILEQKLNLSGLARNNISGQYSTSSSQGLFTGPNMSWSHPFLHATSSREGSANHLNDLMPQTETTFVENSDPSGRGLALTNTPSKSCFNAESCSSSGTLPYTGSTNLDEQGLVSCTEGSAKDAHRSEAEVHGTSTSRHTDTTECEGGVGVGSTSEGWFEGAKIKSGEKPNVKDLSSAPITLNSEILQSDSSGLVDSSCLFSSYESSGFNGSLEELESSRKGSIVHQDLSGEVISEKVACALEEGVVQLETLVDVSKDNHSGNEKADERILDQNNCANTQSESSDLSDSQKFAAALHQMSNMSLEEASSSGVTNLTLPVKLMHHPNSTISDACSEQFTSEVINQHLDSPHLSSCSDKFENHAHAFDDNLTANEVSCSDENPDPSFFKECFGDNECLIEEEDELPTTSYGPPSVDQEVTYAQKYYDPYRWTPEEIKAASGNEECTSIEHNLKVRSVYTDVEDFGGTKDANNEPQVTSYNRKFMGTVDYIWASEDLQTIAVLDTFPKEILKQTIGFPTKKWGSDHIALVCELALRRLPNK